MPTVSVLLPVRDAAPWLPEALASLGTQTHADFEVLVQDDGSTDASLDVACEVARRDPRFRVETKPPRGIVAALNRAAERARGDLLVRMDADDVSTSDRVARLAAYAQAHPETGWLSSRVVCFPPDVVRDGMRRYEAWVNSLLTHEEILRDRFVECPLPHPTWAIRRDVFESLGGYRDDEYPEDYELFLRATEAGVRFAKLPEVLLHWRERPDRLQRRDPRYDAGRFFALKLCHVLPLLVASERRVAVVGAGRWGKRWARALRDAGRDVAAFVDVHPGRVGQRIDDVPVLAHDDLEGVDDAFLVVAVGHARSREAARARLVAAGRRETETFLCVQ